MKREPSIAVNRAFKHVLYSYYVVQRTWSKRLAGFFFNYLKESYTWRLALSFAERFLFVCFKHEFPGSFRKIREVSHSGTSLSTTPTKPGLKGDPKRTWIGTELARCSDALGEELYSSTMITNEIETWTADLIYATAGIKILMSNLWRKENSSNYILHWLKALKDSGGTITQVSSQKF